MHIYYVAIQQLQHHKSVSYNPIFIHVPSEIPRNQELQILTNPVKKKKKKKKKD